MKATQKRKYLIFSGEGEYGNWELTNPITSIGLKRKLTKERCNGDRWAKAYYPDAVMFDGEIRLYPCSGQGDYKAMNQEELIELGYSADEIPQCPEDELPR